MGKPMKSLITIKHSITKRNETLDAYFREVNKYKLLSSEEEISLVRKFRAGDVAAGEKVVYANLRFVISVAKVYENRGLPLADLISAGNLGLVKALRRFDEVRGWKFISYAVWWIRQCILQDLAENGRMIRLPLNVTTKNNKHWKQTGEDLPGLADLRVMSLDITFEDSGDSPMDLLRDYDTPAPDDFTLGKPMVHELIKKLNPREQEIIRMRYGIGYTEPMTYDIIAIELDEHKPCSIERIRQIHDKAIRRLKAYARLTNKEIFF